MIIHVPDRVRAKCAAMHMMGEQNILIKYHNITCSYNYMCHIDEEL